MSSRSDIPNRLIYTCNCGWIDIGHLVSVEKPSNRHASAAYLWKDVSLERGLQVTGKPDHHLVMYRQGMRKFGLSRDFTKFYFIRKGLPLATQRSVALAIFKEVSLGFEDVQASLSAFTDSGFSEEEIWCQTCSAFMWPYSATWTGATTASQYRQKLRALFGTRWAQWVHAKTANLYPSCMPAKNAKPSTTLHSLIFRPSFPRSVQPSKARTSSKQQAPRPAYLYRCTCCPPCLSEGP